MNLLRSNGHTVAVVMALFSLTCLLTACGGGSERGTSTETDLPVVDLWPAAGNGTLTPTRDGCGILAGPVSPGGRFVFTVTDSVLPGHAPVPRNISERVVFAQLYETLVRVSCSGEAGPGLAESWTSTRDHTVWTFTLREGARFWDGSNVTAADVSSAWHDHSGLTVDVLDDRRLAVELTGPDNRFPMTLAQPSTAVSVRRPGWTWPVGSGPCRLRASDPAPLPDLTCRPNQNHPDWPTWKTLTFRVSPGTDPRDLVATDMDLIMVPTTDAAEFFDHAPGFHSVPLPWNRLYLLVCPPEMNPHGAERWFQAAARLDAGRDVTSVSARAWSEIVFPAGGNDRCSPRSRPVTGAVSARLDWNLAEKNLDQDVLVYRGVDSGAREMAHRLGALAGAPARTAALPAAGVEFALQWQMAGAFVISLEQASPTGCLQLATLLGKADWLRKAALGWSGHQGETLTAADQVAAYPQVPASEALVDRGLVRPLGLSRSWLVVRGSMAGLELAHDGVPLLAGLGVAAGPVTDEATP